MKKHIYWLVAILVFTSLFFVYNENMFWKKAYKDISEYPEDNWQVATMGTQGEDYTLLRINGGLKEAVGHPDYPIRVGVAVPVESIKDSNPTLEALEDMITERFNEDKSGVGCLIITSLDGDQFKEFVFYTKENVDFKTLHEELQEAFPSLEVQFYAEKDPQWSVYKEYVK
jgi:hypothetical protein